MVYQWRGIICWFELMWWEVRLRGSFLPELCKRSAMFHFSLKLGFALEMVFKMTSFNIRNYIKRVRDGQNHSLSKMQVLYIKFYHHQENIEIFWLHNCRFFRLSIFLIQSMGAAEDKAVSRKW